MCRKVHSLTYRVNRPEARAEPNERVFVIVARLRQNVSRTHEIEIHAIGLMPERSVNGLPPICGRSPLIF